jgi:hypothetical protein
MAYLHHYQTFDDTGNFYLNFTDPDIAQHTPVKVLDQVSKGMLGLAVGLYLTGVEIDQHNLQVFAAVANFVLHMPSLWKNTNIPYGIDYTAYINQANQVAHGQRDYTKLSSL